VFGELDDRRPESAGPGVDEHLLTRLHLGTVDENLPGGQRHQRHRGRLVVGERARFGRDVGLVDCDELREGTDAQVTGTGMDLVADVEVPHVGADPGDDAGHVVAEHERRLVLQELLELAISDHLVQGIDADGAHPDEDVSGPDLGLGYVGSAHAVLAVPLDNVCLHVS